MFDDIFSSVPSRITDQIYQGNSNCSRDKESLKKLGITHILVAGKWLERHFPGEFEYFQIEVNDIDSEQLYPYFNEVYK